MQVTGSSEEIRSALAHPQSHTTSTISAWITHATGCSSFLTTCTMRASNSGRTTTADIVLGKRVFTLLLDGTYGDEQGVGKSIELVSMLLVKHLQRTEALRRLMSIHVSHHGYGLSGRPLHGRGASQRQGHLHNHLEPIEKPCFIINHSLKHIQTTPVCLQTYYL